MLKKLLLLAPLIASPAFAFLDYCQDIALPTGFVFANDKSSLCHFEEGLTVIKANNEARYGFVNEQGRVVIAPNYSEAYNFQDGLALVKTDRYGYINPQGRQIIVPQFLDAWGFNDGLAKVSINGKIGFIDKTGKTVIAPQFDDSKDWFSAGTVGVYNKTLGKWGLIDKTGQLIAPYSYDSIGEAVDGRILVGKRLATDDDSTRYGYLDLTGNVAIAPVFQSAKPFKNGVAEVVRDGKTLTINKAGQSVAPKLTFEY